MALQMEVKNVALLKEKRNDEGILGTVPGTPVKHYLKFTCDYSDDDDGEKKVADWSLQSHKNILLGKTKQVFLIIKKQMLKKIIKSKFIDRDIRRGTKKL